MRVGDGRIQGGGARGEVLRLVRSFLRAQKRDPRQTAGIVGARKPGLVQQFERVAGAALLDHGIAVQRQPCMRRSLPLLPRPAQAAEAVQVLCFNLGAPDGEGRRFVLCKELRVPVVQFNEACQIVAGLRRRDNQFLAPLPLGPAPRVARGLARGGQRVGRAFPRQQLFGFPAVFGPTFPQGAPARRHHRNRCADEHGEDEDPFGEPFRLAPWVKAAQQVLHVAAGHLHGEHGVLKVGIALAEHILETDQHIRRVLHRHADHVRLLVGVQFGDGCVGVVAVRDDEEAERLSGGHLAQVDEVAGEQRLRLGAPPKLPLAESPALPDPLRRRVELNLCVGVGKEQFWVPVPGADSVRVHAQAVDIAAALPDEVHADRAAFPKLEARGVKLEFLKVLKHGLARVFLVRNLDQAGQVKPLEAERAEVGTAPLHCVMRRHPHGALGRLNSVWAGGASQARHRESGTCHSATQCRDASSSKNAHGQFPAVECPLACPSQL